MQTIPASAAGVPKRQSCDRCHKQKLRCNRSSEDGACDRCSRSKSQCVYSSCLPKGRPSSNRPRKRKLSDLSGRQPSGLNGTGNLGVDLGAIDGNSPYNSAIPSIIEEQHVNDYLDAINWADTPSVDWTEIENSIMHPEPWNFETSVSQYMIQHSFSPNSRENSMMDLIPTPARGTHLSNHVAEKQTCSGDAQKTSHQATNQEKRGPESLIARLSELSTRACSLYSAVLDLANSMETLEQSSIELHRKGPFADDSAFQTLTSWLVSASSDVRPLTRPQRASGTSSTADEGCDLLHNIFAASHDLLGTLQLLNDQFSQPSMNAHSELLRSHPSDTITPASVSPSVGSIASTPSSGDSFRGPGHRSSSMVRHMVMACHMMLLNVYLAVTMSLQHAIDSRNLTDDSTSIQSDPLGEVRTMVVVQLCTFLTERQAKAVQTFLTRSSLPGPGSERPDVSTLSDSDQAATKELEQDLSHRLARLKASTHV
ncbi:hypothetical protein AUEXF2481DRAFT_25182 [Aureobasidium subglaciale EXF-2481]|uniref:Zn(2)-C6 fungal-type domain-containing protein n=1 Tax=Aureobasidium subglaciale (strain EXF-2481) TaxID=1043005 RepID=A0A074YT17_AURSE|nr:uncharacterized protein AUEXF2481DRAFT_25182 [Aureobasidium subglaciale EXF-2481]KER00904.1 hypothetical protein AUEXF2481DRAFT_25182 [Aureobasidium subglaciale EXF-2481]